MYTLRIPAAAALTALVLSACAGWQPAPEGQPSPPGGSTSPAGTQAPEGGATAAAQPRDQPAGAAVEVFPLQNPAVHDLVADAQSAASVGDYGKATVLLERALRIEPRDPELLQQMAELQLKNRDYQQALNFAIRSYDSGSRTGELCSRNWQTIGEARGHLGDTAGADEARNRAASCSGNY
jgi:predicted Zn-dependent protease